MKKFLVTILALAYLVTTTGATLHMHYCMGKMYSVDLVKDDSCTKCGMKESSGCCDDELKVIKVNDDHQIGSNVINLTPLAVTLIANYSSIHPAHHDVASTIATRTNSPPPSFANSLRILYGVFII